MSIRISNQQSKAISALAERHGVARLDLFGSAATDAFDPDTSDIDVLVVFKSDLPDGRFKAFFGLQSGLATLFGRPVDLVSENSVQNPYLLRSMNRTRRLLYVA